MVDDTRTWKGVLAGARNGDCIRLTGPTRVTETLDWPDVSGLRIVGPAAVPFPSGNPRKETFDDIGAGIWADFDGPLFRFHTALGMGGASMENLTLWRPYGGSHSPGSVAVQWVYGGRFVRGFRIANCAMRGFEKAMEVTAPEFPTTAKEVLGNLQVTGCNIQGNGRLYENSDRTRVNGFLFRDNDAGQNGVTRMGGLFVRGTCLSFLHNILEGQRNALHVVDSSYFVTVGEGNYFEANTGDFVVCLSMCQKIRYEYNSVGRPKMDRPVLIERCAGGDVYGEAEMVDCKDVRRHK